MGERGTRQWNSQQSWIWLLSETHQRWSWAWLERNRSGKSKIFDDSAAAQTQRVKNTFTSYSFFTFYKPKALNILSYHSFFTFHCLDPFFEVHKGVVFNLLHSFNSTESANGTVPSTSKAIQICDVCDAVHLSNVSLRFSSVTVAVRFLRSWAWLDEFWI